jgi:beta-carotene/zeaxanthin 4-ketolase
VPFLLLAAWILSLLGICEIDLERCPIWLVAVFMALRTFLQTGLFITAHDAMHGSISRSQPINQAIGSLCTTLYAFLPYQLLATKHHLHHQHPASDLDPDFSTKPMMSWYVHFMGGYVNRSQFLKILLGMAVIFTLAHALGQVPPLNLLLMWVLPIWFSSLQLFYFGTYLPHRSPLVVAESDAGEKFINRHRARSSNLPIGWSFLACYHFGYHWEHHEYPQIPWYDLPSVKKM